MITFLFLILYLITQLNNQKLQKEKLLFVLNHGPNFEEESVITEFIYCGNASSRKVK